MSKHIYDVDVFDIEKRYKPSKHYVYCIWVTWNDGKRQLIYRRYSQFFDLQCKLLDTFKKEAGVYEPTDRILPFLPGKIIFGRSHIKSVALDRLNHINNYCKKLITLKKDISCSYFVLKFFELNNDDISQSTHKQDLSKTKVDSKSTENLSNSSISQPIKTEEYICIHDYKAGSKTELNLKKNTKVNVVEKNLNGWWFVENAQSVGYVPQCILKPLNKTLDDESTRPIRSEQIENFIVIKDYQANKTDEVSLKKGDYVQIIEKNLSGWWTVKSNNGSIGIAPAVCLEKISSFDPNEPLKYSVNAWHLFGSNNNEHLPLRENKFDDTSSINTFQSFNTTNSYQIFNDLQNDDVDSIYYIIDDYIDSVGDGVNLKKGEKVHVLDKESSSGWWYVKLDDLLIEGWAPCAFLSKDKPKPAKPPKPPRPPRPQLGYSQIINNSLNKNLNSNLNDVNLDQSDLSYKPVKVSELKKKFQN